MLIIVFELLLVDSSSRQRANVLSLYGVYEGSIPFDVEMVAEGLMWAIACQCDRVG